MNKEELFEVIEDIKECHVKEARETVGKRPIWKHHWVQAVAAVLVVAVLGGVMFWPNGSPLVPSAYAIAEARYPEMAHYPDQMDYLENRDYEGFSVAYEAWWQGQKNQQGPKGYADGLDSFFIATIQAFLSDAQGENQVYSPLSLYMALAMLAEITDGESRGQILNLLDHESMESLREQAGYLWNANYRDDGVTTSVLASSVWLNEDVSYVQETMDALAKNYYASSYQGEMGSEEYNEAFRNWLNEQTGGLLEEQAEKLELSPEMILALASTVYFKAAWSSKFEPKDTVQGNFHAPSGDVTIDFMNQEGLFENYFWGDHFGAVAQYMDNAGSMWYFLPDEGFDVEDLLNDTQVMECILAGYAWEQRQMMMVNLSVPKFDVCSQMDLKDKLMDLGVTDVFEPSQSDFSPLTTQMDGISVSKVQHDARVVIDEEGCTAAAYTAMMMLGGTPQGDEIDFVLDRPFLFVLTGIDGLPLFVGVVNNP